MTAPSSMWPAGFPTMVPVPFLLGMAGSAATRARARHGPQVWAARVPPGKTQAEGRRAGEARNRTKEKRGPPRRNDARATREAAALRLPIAGSIVDLMGPVRVCNAGPRLGAWRIPVLRMYPRSN